MTYRIKQVTYLLCITVLANYSEVIAQNDPASIYSSPQTQIIISQKPPTTIGATEYSTMLERLNRWLGKIETYYQIRIDPLGVKRRDPLNNRLGQMAEEVTIGSIGSLPGGGGAERFYDYGKKLETEDMQPFIKERLFNQNALLNGFFSAVRQQCNNDLSCIQNIAQKVSADPQVRQFLAENPGLIEEAKVKELIAASSANADFAQQENVQRFNSQEELVKAMATTFQAQLSRIVDDQQTLIRNTATIIHTQQEHTIALAEIQSTIDKNQQELRDRLEQGFGSVIELQNQNIFLTSMVLAHTMEIDGKLDIALVKLDSIGEDANKIRERQLSQIFNSSSSIDRLNMLEGEEGKELVKDEEERRRLIERMKILIREEQIIAVTKKVREWGIVSLEALNVIYPNCPPEITKLVSVSITASDIIGSITSGNWSQAILSGLSLFKSPRPGPEMQMLTRITEQLTSLEAGMNAQFREVHEHLFAMEKNIVARLDIVDQKLDLISEQVQFAYTELSEQLLSVDSKISYVVKQNDCTENLILDIFKSNNSDVCEIPVREFKKSVAQGLINSIDDLERFFIGQQCKSCIEALFNNSSQNLVTSSLFRYSYCITDAVNDNSRPDNIYEFIFNRLVPENFKSNALGVFSVFYLPQYVQDAASLMDSIGALPDSMKEKIQAGYESFTLTEADRQYRHYVAVLEFADYVLTMMPFLELYNDGGLIKYQQLQTMPEISRERSKKIILFLDNISDLIDHTIFQQSLMTGLSSFALVDEMIGKGNSSDAAGITLHDVFLYNPLFSKNYSAYFLERKFGGVKRLNIIAKGNSLKKTGYYYQGNNFYESIISKDRNGNMILSTNWSGNQDKKSIFQSYLPGISGDTVDNIIYKNNLMTAIPRSLPALLRAKNRINLISSQMRFIVSDELDAGNDGLTRKELDFILQTQKSR